MADGTSHAANATVARRGAGPRGGSGQNAHGCDVDLPAVPGRHRTSGHDGFVVSHLVPGLRAAVAAGALEPAERRGAGSEAAFVHPRQAREVSGGVRFSLSLSI